MEKRSFIPIDKKYLVLSLVITIGMLAYEIHYFTGYYDGFGVLENLYNGLYPRALKTVALAVPSYFLTFGFIYAALISGYPYRIVYFLLFSFGILIEYSFQKFFIRFTNTEDLANIIYAVDWRVRSNSAQEYFLPFSFLPCLVFLGFLIFLKPKRPPEGIKMLLTVVLVFFGFFAATAYLSTNMFPTLSSNAF
jgi:hypothetical protein